MKIDEYKELNVEFFDNHITSRIKSENGISLYLQNGKYYMILERNYNHNKLELFDLNKNNYDLNIISRGSEIHSSFIVDLNGIDNFITSKSLVFNDYDVRELIIEHLQLHTGKYKRFGVSGSRANQKHPGGEVVEIQTLDIENKLGKARSVSGYMALPQNEYSKAISLTEDGINLREERTVYSHTEWMPEESVDSDIVVKITAKNDNVSLLTVIYEFCKEMYIEASGITAKLGDGKRIDVKGRVLKHIPSKPFLELQEAKDIAIEKEFGLPKEASMNMYGTLYKRYEPEWKEFTNGRQYEKRGHYHAFINGNELERIHEVFHVRDVYLHKGVSVEIEIHPVENIYRIFHVEEKDGEYFICSSNKNIKKYAEQFYKHDKYL